MTKTIIKPPKPCAHCAATFVPFRVTTQYCGRACKENAKRKRRYVPREHPKKPCAVCAEVFIPASHNEAYCSEGCRRDGKRTARRRHFSANRERHIEYMRKWRKANPERVREAARKHCKANPERVLATTRKWREANPDHLAALGGKGNATQRSKHNCIPQGFDLASTTPFYMQSRLLTSFTGIAHHVDHIIPINRGGMHSPENLQVITAAENLVKQDKLGTEHTCRLRALYRIHMRRYRIPVRVS